MPGELHDAAFGRKVPAEDREAACRGEQGLDRTATSSLPARRRPRRPLQGAAVHVRRLAVDETCLHELSCDERDTAGFVHVGCDERPPGEARDDRSPRGDSIEVVELERDPDLACDREQWRTPFMEPPVAATDAAAFSSASRVTIWDGRSPCRTRSIANRPRLLGRTLFAGSSAGMPFNPAG